VQGESNTAKKYSRPYDNSGLGGSSHTTEYAGNREKWLIILLLVIVGAVVVVSIALYGPHWMKGISAFI